MNISLLNQQEIKQNQKQENNNSQQFLNNGFKSSSRKTIPSIKLKENPLLKMHETHRGTCRKSEEVNLLNKNEHNRYSLFKEIKKAESLDKKKQQNTIETNQLQFQLKNRDIIKENEILIQEQQANQKKIKEKENTLERVEINEVNNIKKNLNNNYQNNSYRRVVTNNSSPTKASKNDEVGSDIVNNLNNIFSQFSTKGSKQTFENQSPSLEQQNYSEIHHSLQNNCCINNNESNQEQQVLEEDLIRKISFEEKSETQSIKKFEISRSQKIILDTDKKQIQQQNLDEIQQNKNQKEIRFQNDNCLRKEQLNDVLNNLEEFPFTDDNNKQNQNKYSIIIKEEQEKIIELQDNLQKKDQSNKELVIAMGKQFRIIKDLQRFLEQRDLFIIQQKNTIKQQENQLQEFKNNQQKLQHEKDQIEQIHTLKQNEQKQMYQLLQQEHQITEQKLQEEMQNKQAMNQQMKDQMKVFQQKIKDIAKQHEVQMNQLEQKMKQKELQNRALIQENDNLRGQLNINEKKNKTYRHEKREKSIENLLQNISIQNRQDCNQQNNFNLLQQKKQSTQPSKSPRNNLIKNGSTQVVTLKFDPQSENSISIVTNPSISGRKIKVQSSDKENYILNKKTQLENYKAHSQEQLDNFNNSINIEKNQFNGNYNNNNNYNNKQQQYSNLQLDINRNLSQQFDNEEQISFGMIQSPYDQKYVKNDKLLQNNQQNSVYGKTNVYCESSNNQMQEIKYNNNKIPNEPIISKEYH
ncbi:hypothetical protein PPERSA_02305 [Pseudocohnilembus persalinus]|uniref:Uncharacterized protein n=1 Tax=Pseudocohnilembus persalinus TaxID=266149 RepID=A0A0V0QUI9_PSEPJ|nr:hypothetical protein PPERSA_02305 [Pseudocohnilembus persalinus]|eukprot:KRX05773.1 hypothetical protein PPERSA_02305 [Pseudocohnilembus persalinus]